MYCKRTAVKNFRNIKEADVSFSGGVNILVGENAQGKTNLLEAIFLASVGRSFRASNSAEMIMFGQKSATVSLDYLCEGRSRDDNITLTLFTDKKTYKDIIKKVEAQKDNVKTFELCVKHFIDTNQKFPIWAYIELFTFGNISHLYTISDLSLKKIVAADLGFSMNKGWLHIGSSLRVITTLRNLCAHGSRLYHRRFISKPTMSKKDEKYLSIYTDGTLDNEHLFSYLLAIKRLVSKDSFQNFLCEFKNLCKLYPSVDLSKYGFPTYWEDALAY